MTDKEIAKAIAHLKDNTSYGYGAVSEFTIGMLDSGLIETQLIPEFGRTAYCAYLTDDGKAFVEEHA